MKDKFIQKKLEFYADSLECKEELLHDAYAQMDFVVSTQADFDARQTVMPSKKRPALKKASLKVAIITVIASMAAVMLLVFVVLPVLSDFFSGIRLGSRIPSKPEQYSLYSLARVQAEYGEIKEIENIKIIDDEDFVLTEIYLFKNKQTKEVYAAALKYKTERKGSIDEILIVSDLKGGLTGYSDLNEGETVKNYDVYEKGEYYSYISIRAGGHAYYVTITSPARYAADEYENLII